MHLNESFRLRSQIVFNRLANQLQITSIPQVLNHNYKLQIFFYPTFQILFISSLIALTLCFESIK